MDEFQDLDSDILTNMLRILDGFYISFRTLKFSHIEDKVKELREDIFQLTREKFDIVYLHLFIYEL